MTEFDDEFRNVEGTGPMKRPVSRTQTDLNRRIFFRYALGGLTTAVLSSDFMPASAVPLDEARRELNLGDAEAANNNFEGARAHWQRAIELGFANDAQVGVIAQKRLQMYTLTCSFNGKSLYQLRLILEKPYPGCLVNNVVIQQALRALGYYKGPLDGSMSESTRLAIRRYQRDMSFDETDDLSPRQIVLLIANAAETARDEASQTTLALMYAAGVGVVPSKSFALAWLRSASGREFGLATLYLALLHGTGYCGFPMLQDHATQYLKEACQQKNALAVELVHRYGRIGDQVSRWAKIGADPDVKICMLPISNQCGLLSGSQP